MNGFEIVFGIFLDCLLVENGLLNKNYDLYMIVLLILLIDVRDRNREIYIGIYG